MTALPPPQCVCYSGRHAKQPPWSDCFFFELELIPGQFVISTWSESQQDTLKPVLATLHPPFPLLWAPTNCCKQRFPNPENLQSPLLEKGSSSALCLFWCLVLITLFLAWLDIPKCQAVLVNGWIEFVPPSPRTSTFKQSPYRYLFLQIDNDNPQIQVQNPFRSAWAWRSDYGKQIKKGDWPLAIFIFFFFLLMKKCFCSLKCT